MKLIQRVGYYLGGLAIGLIILAFFFNAKRTSCSYGPQSRVLKTLNSKKITYGDEVNRSDSSLVKKILNNGHVNFSKSNPRKEPCGLYVIEEDHENKMMILTLENCDSMVKVLTIKNKASH
ncbi:hypothetical protein [Aestuariivivens sediminis]|uniref:hypothetical protein n=1 Tax=Aestuariivivens sediminis TaxID=2913557 RepID=UPI001F55C551|nr:hypothetical protein [Aestuariivivens sediminis]